MTDQNYFARMGQLLLRELSVPAERSRLGPLAHRELMRHISGPMARDAGLPMTSAMPMDQDPSELGPDELAAFVRILLGKLAGPARQQFTEQLMSMLDTEPAQDDGELLIKHNPNGNGGGGRNNMPGYGDFVSPAGNHISGVPNNNRGATDMRSGNRTGRDRRPAQDSAAAVRGLNSGARARGFNGRWGNLVGNISLNGAGR